jgi:hypothetical protein
MQTPRVIEISALSAHRREVPLGRWAPAPADQHEESARGADPLRSIAPEPAQRDRAPQDG